MFPKQLVQAIKSGHVHFMNELSERLNNWKWQGFLGDIFAKLGNSYHVSEMFSQKQKFIKYYVNKKENYNYM